MTDYESMFIKEDFSFLKKAVSSPEIFIFLGIYFNELARKEHDYSRYPIFYDSILSIVDDDEQWGEKRYLLISNYFEELISQNLSVKNCLNESRELPIYDYLMKIEHIENKEKAKEFLDTQLSIYFKDKILDTLFDKTDALNQIIFERKKLENEIFIINHNKKGFKI